MINFQTHYSHFRNTVGFRKHSNVKKHTSESNNAGTRERGQNTKSQILCIKVTSLTTTLKDAAKIPFPKSLAMSQRLAVGKCVKLKLFFSG